MSFPDYVWAERIPINSYWLEELHPDYTQYQRLFYVVGIAEFGGDYQDDDYFIFAHLVDKETLMLNPLPMILLGSWTLENATRMTVHDI